MYGYRAIACFGSMLTALTFLIAQTSDRPLDNHTALLVVPAVISGLLTCDMAGLQNCCRSWLVIILLSVLFCSIPLLTLHHPLFFQELAVVSLLAGLRVQIPLVWQIIHNAVQCSVGDPARDAL